MRTVAEIHLDHLAHNARAIRDRVAPAQVIPVVKADAYGHGAIPVTRRLLREGFSMFAVARLEEALELRESGISSPILVFGRLFPDEIPQAVQADLRISLFGNEDLDWIEAARQSKPAHVHVKFDTGMGRVGVLAPERLQLQDRLARSKACVWEGAYSHFATSDEKDKRYAREQLGRFKEIVAGFAALPAYPRMVHMANSGAILDLPESTFDAVRAGILLYGHFPSRACSGDLPLKQVMTLKTVVAHVRRVPQGFSVSYGRRWISPKATTLAVLPIGYADGVRRHLSNTGEVLIRGKRFPMVGAVTMDQTVVDVGEEPISPGDEAVLWGDSPQGSIQALEVAEKIGTIAYEITCGVTTRVTRVYVEESPAGSAGESGVGEAPGRE